MSCFFGRFCCSGVFRGGVAALFALILISTTGCHSIPPIGKAARAGNVEKVAALVKANPAIVHSEDSEGNTPFALGSDRW